MMTVSPVSTSVPQLAVDVLYKEPMTTVSTSTVTSSEPSSITSTTISGNGITEVEKVVTEGPTEPPSTDRNFETANEENEEIAELETATPDSVLEQLLRERDRDPNSRNDVF